MYIKIGLGFWDSHYALVELIIIHNCASFDS